MKIQKELDLLNNEAVNLLAELYYKLGCIAEDKEDIKLASLFYHNGNLLLARNTNALSKIELIKDLLIDTQKQ